MITDVAALFVDSRGEYPRHFATWFDEKRDARSYVGELPVIAHPPCQRWCRLEQANEERESIATPPEFAAELLRLASWAVTEC
jgi:hypothetical protein